MSRMVVFTLKCMCATMITDGFHPTPNVRWRMVRDALAHAVWPRGQDFHDGFVFSLRRPAPWIL